MKKNLIILFAIINVSTYFFFETKAQFSAGLRLGFNASKFTGPDAAGAKFVPGLHIGPYFRMAFKEKYRVQIDVLFSTKGAVYNYNFYGSTQRYYVIPFYIDVPVMFNYKPIAGLYVEAGVQPSVALTTLKFSTNDASTFTSPSTSGYKFVVIAPIVGIGYEFKKASLGMRAAFSGSNIYNTTGADYSSSYSYVPAITTVMHNLTLMATFGFKF